MPVMSCTGLLHVGDCIPLADVHSEPDSVAQCATSTIPEHCSHQPSLDRPRREKKYELGRKITVTRTFATLYILYLCLWSYHGVGKAQMHLCIMLVPSYGRDIPCCQHLQDSVFLIPSMIEDTAVYEMNQPTTHNNKQGKKKKKRGINSALQG